MNKSKHLSVEFCKSDGVSKLINDPHFMSIDEFEDDSFEVIIIVYKNVAFVCVCVCVCMPVCVNVSISMF